jgi:hypothetical protein
MEMTDACTQLKSGDFGFEQEGVKGTEEGE